jgi:hypothetical protein
VIPSPYMLLAALIAAIGLALGGFSYGRHTEQLAFNAYKSQQAAIAEKAAADSQAHARAVELAAEEKQVQIAQTYQEQINAISKTRDSLIAAAGSDHRVYVRVSRPGADGVPKAAASGSVDNADSSAALDVGSASFFYHEFASADQLAEQLAAAQQIIRQDRLTCNGQSQ